MNTIGSTIIQYEDTVSTNEEGKRLAAEGARDGTVIVADRQTGGKGRMGRSWESPHREGIFLSVILKPDFAPGDAQQLTLMAAVAVCAAVEEASGLVPAIKWPNDVLLHNKKICGILTELNSTMDTIHYIICGIGINVNNETFPASLRNPATSLFMETGQKHDLWGIIKPLLREMNSWYAGYPRTRPDLMQTYKSKCLTLNREVIITNSATQYTGLALDIMEDGGLLVEGRDGGRHIVYAGEVSIRNA